jgi:hypothetical protein
MRDSLPKQTEEKLWCQQSSGVSKILVPEKLRYPSLELFYFQWQETYESTFEGQECHLGSGKEIFLRTCGLVNGRVLLLREALQEFMNEVRETKLSLFKIPEKRGLLI